MIDHNIEKAYTVERRSMRSSSSADAGVTFTVTELELCEATSRRALGTAAALAHAAAAMKARVGANLTMAADRGVFGSGERLRKRGEVLMRLTGNHCTPKV